jgi:dihydroxy-acid dehydratase
VHGRRLNLDVSDEVLAERRATMEAAERPWMPADRDRTVTTALRTYAAFASSASTGAVRDLCRIHER